MKTRAKKAGKPAVEATTPVSRSRSLPDNVDKPPSLFILPRDLSSHARIVLVPDPARSSKTLRILACPDRGLYEFTNLAQERSCRSLLLAPQRTASQDGSQSKEDQGYLLRRPDLLIATPIDPLFIILPMMVGSKEIQDSYLSCTDYIFSLELEGYELLQSLLGQPIFGSLLKKIESRMITICDSISLGDDEDLMYRLSMEKLSRALIWKATHMADVGLPASLEDQFVKQALERPLDHSKGLECDAADEIQPVDTTPVNNASQDSNLSDDTHNSASTAPTSVSAAPDDSNGPSEQVVHLLRIRTAWDYMLRSYISTSLHQSLATALQQQSLIDLKPLLEYEERINAMRQEAQALRALSDNISRKRMLDVDDSTARVDEKRRKKEEEEQRKKSVSHGVKKLMKADTSGMKKLSSFFTKTPAAK